MKKEQLKKLTALRHQLHKNAEVAFQEKNTAAIIIEFLNNTQPAKIETGIGGYGLYAKYEGKKSGLSLLFRAELDALPISETNELPYLSQNKDNGHKCGHDGHMAILCGLALELQKGEFAGNVYLLFQPAEETGQGALKMLEDQRIKDLKVDYGFALHNLPSFKKGQLILKENVFAAASTGIIIKLKGKPSHASHPKDGINPSLAAAQIIQLFYEVPQMHSKLEEAALITPIGAEIGKKAFGTSAADAEIYATIRTYSNESLDRMVDILVKKAKAIAHAHQLKFENELVEHFDAVVNDAIAYQMLKEANKKMDISIADYPFPWSEDFGHFSQVFPCCFFGLGAGEQQPQLHNEDYDFPDEIIETGINAFYNIIEKY